MAAHLSNFTIKRSIQDLEVMVLLRGGAWRSLLSGQGFFFHSVGSAGFSLPVLKFPPFATADEVSIYLGRYCRYNTSGSVVTETSCDPAFSPFGSFIFEDRVYYWKSER